MFGQWVWSFIVGMSISQKKCYRYWPDEGVAGGYYGNLHVAVVNRVHKQHYTITQFTIKSDKVCYKHTQYLHCTVYMYMYLVLYTCTCTLYCIHVHVSEKFCVEKFNFASQMYKLIFERHTSKIHQQQNI